MTTGIVGVPVVPNARAVFIDLLERTIDQAKYYSEKDPVVSTPFPLVC